MLQTFLAWRIHVSSLALERHLCCHGGWLCVTHRSGRGRGRERKCLGQRRARLFTNTLLLPQLCLNIPWGVFWLFKGRPESSLKNPLCCSWICPLFLRIDVELMVVNKCFSTNHATFKEFQQNTLLCVMLVLLCLGEKRA